MFREALSHDVDQVLLIEHPLFFTQYRFHIQKLMLHHVSMRQLQSEFETIGRRVEIISVEELSSGSLRVSLDRRDVRFVTVYDLVDDWLERDVLAATEGRGLTIWDSPNFLCSPTDLENYLHQTKTNPLRMATFYGWQRRRLRILVDGQQKPIGGKWSFDAENREPLPASVTPPEISRPEYSAAQQAWIEESRSRFAGSPGESDFAYPVSPEQAQQHVRQFLAERFAQFGVYEDALSSRSRTLFHSVLTPTLNAGILNPREITDAVLAEQSRIPINSLEGFIRQIIGWREFVRLAYVHRGRTMRTRNALQHGNPIPEAFWKGTTGLPPIDLAVSHVMQDGYTHHIERLMVLGTFLLLTETHPDEVYEWFMSLFIDAYDWVMVPNVYGMSQYADGGLITTKPYVCGSRYLRSMGDYPPGRWTDIWDSLYWRWIAQHLELVDANPRSKVIAQAWRRFSPDKQAGLISTADRFLAEYRTKADLRAASPLFS